MRTYATWLVDDGVPVNMVQRVMGHERSSTTLDLYTRRWRSAVITHMKIDLNNSRGHLTWDFKGGRYWDRTSDLFGVNEALSR